MIEIYLIRLNHINIKVDFEGTDAFLYLFTGTFEVIYLADDNLSIKSCWLLNFNLWSYKKLILLYILTLYEEDGRMNFYEYDDPV